MVYAATTARYDRIRHGVYNLHRTEVIANPWNYLEGIVELGPVFHDEVGGVWVCTGHEESVRILTDQGRFSSTRQRSSAELSERGLPQLARVSEALSRQILFAGPPGHGALRRRLRDQFSVRTIASRDDVLSRIAAETLDSLPDDGSIDVVGEFAEHLPTRLVEVLLGMPGRGPELRRWADAYERLLGSLSTFPHVADQDVIPVLDEALSQLRALARERAAVPGDDLISSLTRPVEGAGPDDDEIDTVAANCLVVVAGGYQTLTHLITAGLVLLDRFPSQRALLRERPDLASSAVAEVLRLDGSSQYVARHATETVQIGDTEIPAGRTVLVHLGAANRDPRRFTDPHTFDITREQGRHLGFGMGAHYCIGAPYAERLAQKALLGFLERYPDHTLPDGPGDREWGTHANTRCLARARVDLAPVASPSGDGAAERHESTAATWHGVFEDRVHRAPDAVAVEDDDRTLTCAELDCEANGLAHALRGRGVEPGVVVAITGERRADLAVAALAVAKAGGTFLFVEPDCPTERLRSMAEDAGVRLVLCDPASVWPLTDAGLGVPVLPVAGTASASTPPQVGAQAGHPAYIVFTSGTTGRPKPIATAHEGLVNLHRAQREVFALDDDDRVLQYLSLNFDGCVFELAMGLLSDATLVFARGTALTVGPPLLRTLRDRRITAVTMTPSVWAALPDEALPNLRIGAAAGERLPAAVARRWRPGRRFLNLYGPAEAAVWSTWHECAEHEDEPPIGHPVPGKHVVLLGDDGVPVDPGEYGELCVGGAGIGRYLGRPELMQEQYLPDPAPSSPGGLLYRTGDHCRTRPDGTLVYGGRRDRQTKIRGQRVELDEVERVLENGPGVESCLVDAVDGQLHAAVRVGPSGADEQALRSYLQARLHSGMVPRLHMTDSLPRTASGKVDPSALHRLARNADASPATFPEPRRASEPLPAPIRPTTGRDTRLVWRLARQFALSLAVEQHRVKQDSDFFSLGGDSLAVADLLRTIEQEAGTPVPVGMLLDRPTPTGIADLISNWTGAELGPHDHVDPA